MNNNNTEVQLLPLHLSDLRKSGLSDDQIAACHFYSERDPDRVKVMLSWQRTAGKLGPCLVIPYFDPDGARAEYSRLKPDRPRTQKRNGKTRSTKYEAPMGQPNRAYFPPATVKVLADVSIQLLITEGEKKAAKADQEGFPCVGLSGVWAWQRKRENGGPRELIPDLKAVAWDGRMLVIVFDSDVAENKHVAHALRELRKVLDSLGAKVSVVTLPSGPNGEKVGLDDYLVAHSRDELQALINAARPLPVNQIEGRVLAVLQNGPQALFRDDKLLEMLAELSVVNRAEYFAIYQTLREKKVGLRNFDRVIKPKIAAKLKEQPAEFSRGETGGYFEAEGCICRTKLTPDGPVTVPLCTFTATIVDETIVDDGVEKRWMIGVSGKLATGRPLPRVEVPTRTFPRLEWVISEWGSEPIIWGTEHKHLPPAIQAMSDHSKKQCRTVYTHTGWRDVNGQWLYLHGGGAIGPNGPVGTVSVELSGPLAGFNFGEPTVDTTEAVRASLQILDLADDHITFPVFAAVFRSVIRSCDFALHLAGPSGVFKSELAALVQQHFGSGLDARHLPASWSSTDNALEGLAFQTKDAVMVVDDFAPTGSSADVQRLHRIADRLIRGQGNNSGRGRMNADGSLRPNKPPRGLIMSTGEDSPRGQSLRARMVIIDIGPGDIDMERLTVCQQDAVTGLYTTAMAAFLRWLAPRYSQTQKHWSNKLTELRRELATGDSHARTPGIAADLLLAFQVFTKFAVDRCVIDEAEQKELLLRCRLALVQVANTQADHQATSEPAGHFIRLLTAVISSGRGHLTNPKGDCPDTSPEAWGWSDRKHRTSTGTSDDWMPQGRHVGWIDADAIYLEPEAAYAEVQRLANDQTETLGVTAPTLWKRLRERKYLHVSDEPRGKLKIRKQLSGKRRAVICLRLTTLCDSESGPIGPSSPTHQDSPESDPVFGADSVGTDENRPTETGPILDENRASGQMGRSDEQDIGTEQQDNSSDRERHTI